MNIIKELNSVKDWVHEQTADSEKDAFIFNNIKRYLNGIIEDLERKLFIKEFFKKSNIDCLVSVSQYLSWADGDEDGTYGGVRADLMPELKCLGINTENKTVSEISISDHESQIISDEWYKIVGRPDDSCWVGDGWCDYSWEFLFFQNENLTVASGELSWGEGRDLDKDDIPFLPNKVIQFGSSYNEFNIGDEFLKTKFWETIADKVLLGSFEGNFHK